MKQLNVTKKYHTLHPYISMNTEFEDVLYETYLYLPRHFFFCGLRDRWTDKQGKGQAYRQPIAECV